MAPLPEQPAYKGQVLAGHDGLTGRGVPKVMRPQHTELRISADCPPAAPQRIVALDARMANEQESFRFRLPDSASICACAASPGDGGRGPGLESGRLMASSPVSRDRRLSTSLLRHRVGASSRNAAAGSGILPRGRGASPSSASLFVSMNRVMLFLGLLRVLRQGLAPCLCRPNSLARDTMDGSISKAPFAAARECLLAESSQEFRPRLHECAALFYQIRSRIGLLDRRSHRVRQRQLHDSMRCRCALGSPIPKR